MVEIKFDLYTVKEGDMMSFWTWIIICIPLIAGIAAANYGKKNKDRT
jgi:hypothetical protein